MKVANVRTYLCDPGLGKNWLFVRVETDGVMHGWGECYTQADRDRAIEAHVEELGRYLVGRSPFEIEHFTHVAYRDFAGKRGAMDLPPLRVVEGAIPLPEAPGLGIDLDEAALARDPYRRFPERRIRRPSEEGP